jgi:nicotinamide-nucleotide amidase
VIARILSVGAELVLGHTIDTNSPWLARRLAAVGVETVAHATVPDALDAIREAIDQAARRADVVIVTGGMGPTEDDMSRSALAAALGVELREDTASLERIRALFQSRGLEMPETNRVQALCPVGATPIENTCGTAPGIHARLGLAEVFVLPGVPREMQVMFERDVLPRLAARAGGAVVFDRVLHTFGAPESRIGEMLADLMRPGRHPAVGTAARDAIISVRVYARGRSRQEAEDLAARDVAEIRGRLGSLVFGEGETTLQQAVAELLWRAGVTVATAESCTGGLLAKRLTDVPGSSRYFRQTIVAYANEAKERLLQVPADLLARCGAVSREVAEAMAVNCRRLSETDYALSITGIAGPEGGTRDKPVGLVFIGLAGTDGCDVRELRLGEQLSRWEVRDRSAKAALNLLRLRLLNIR